MAKKVTERVIEIDARGAENTIRALREEVRKLTGVQKDLDMESAEFRNISSELTAAQTKLRNAVQGNTAAVEGSYKAYSHQLQVLKEHRKWLAEGTEEYRKATEEISKLDQKLKQMDAEIGVHGRNVGNYSSAFDGLNQSVAQVTRELPSLTLGANQFFLAISNNLPILYDNIKGYQAMAKEGKTNVGVIRALGNAFFSMNTVITIGVTLLASFGDEILEIIGKLLGFNKETKEVERRMSESARAAQAFANALYEQRASASELIVAFKTLQIQWFELGENMEAKEKFLEENINAFERLGIQIDSVTEAEKLFNDNHWAFVDAMDARARAVAAQEIAVETYKELLKKESFIDLSTPGVKLKDPNERAEWERVHVVPLRQEYSKYIGKAVEYAAEERRILSGAGIRRAGSGGGKYADKGSSKKGVNVVDNRIDVTGAYTKDILGIPTLGGLAIDEGASIEANKARLVALAQMEGASAEERKAIEQSLQEELAFIEQTRLEAHEMVLLEMLRSDELTADERIALEEELTANQVAQAELRAKAAEEQAEAEKKAAEEVMAIEKKKEQLKQQMMQNASTMLKNFASTLEENTAEYKAIQSASVVIDTIAAAMAGYKQGMTYGGPAAPLLAAFNLATAISTGAAQLHALWAVKTDGSNADSALSSAQVPNVASSMPASYTRNLMGDNELSELNKDMRVYVVEQDITDTQKKAKTREESASF